MTANFKMQIIDGGMIFRPLWHKSLGGLALWILSQMGLSLKQAIQLDKDAQRFSRAIIASS